MLTPIFNIQQTTRHVIFRLRLPYVKISSAETFVEGKTFKFFLHPYFLSLVLENELASNSIESAVYDHNTYYLTITVLKKTEGEPFTNLDMITALMQPVGKQENKTKLKPNIQVLSEQSTEGDEQITSLQKEMEGLAVSKFRYGFNGNFTDVFQTFQVISSGGDSRHWGSQPRRSRGG
jgi:protein SHQ1